MIPSPISRYYFNHAKFDNSIEDFFLACGDKFERIDSPADDERVNENGAIVFVHTTNYDFWIQKAKDNPLTNYILVSSVPSSLMALRSGHSSNLHICEISANELHGNKQIEALMRGLRSGTFNSALLRRGGFSAKVAEIYLLLYAKRVGQLREPEQLGDLSTHNIWQSTAELSPRLASCLPTHWRDFWLMGSDEINKAISCIKRALKQTAMLDASYKAGAVLALPLTDESRRLAAVKSRLRHSWLENQVLNRDSSVVADRHDALTEAGIVFKKKICANGEFAGAAKAARELCDIMIDGLSPARLLDRKPLSLLPGELNKLLADDLHQLYLERSRIEKSKSELQTAIMEFEGVLFMLCRLWNAEPRVEREAVKTAFEGLQCIGRKLHAALGSVPQGTVLP
jgi:hypothetical protein